MSNETKQKPEMTVEEFIEYYGEMIINHGNKRELRADLRSVIRKELRKYDRWLSCQLWGLGDIVAAEKAVDEFLNENWIE